MQAKFIASLVKYLLFYNTKLKLYEGWKQITFKTVLELKWWKNWLHHYNYVELHHSLSYFLSTKLFNEGGMLFQYTDHTIDF